MSECDELYERHLEKLLTVRRQMNLDTIQSAINILMHLYKQNKDSQSFKGIPGRYASCEKTMKICEKGLAKLLEVRQQMTLDTIQSAIKLKYMYAQNYENEQPLDADTVDERDDKTKDEQEEA